MITDNPIILAFIGNFGGGEIILIFLIVLLLFGAKKVPELFRSLGKGVNEFRKAKNEWEQDIHDVMNQEPLEDHDFDNKKTENKEESQSVEKEGEKQQTAT
ncbi:MAG: twin-arginine translocase TatA/TatE family subunit [Verrucomicrobiota bacterium]|nr:twin-arginine translocase TatA/TatE family subunit [Verrucomicrobiota bacterium]